MAGGAIYISLSIASILTSEATLSARVDAVRDEAIGIRSFELRASDGGCLPAFEPGAHVMVTRPDGLSRCYSLLNDCRERHRYVVAVQKLEGRQGVSAWLHDEVAPGATLSIGAPRNSFRLRDERPATLVAGGIGITPVLSMVRRLAQAGRPWRLLYACRSRAQAAFLDELRHHEACVDLHFDDEQQGQPPALAHWLGLAPDDHHLYACGPAPMLEAFQQATEHRPRDQVHMERFVPPAPVANGHHRPFAVRLARSGQQLAVGADESVLDALLRAGVSIPHSCRQGICGVCETTVLDGCPEHLDSLLSPEEQASNRTMLVCCSRSLSDELVLDL